MICNVCNKEMIDKTQTVKVGRYRWHLLCYADKQVDNDVVERNPNKTSSPYWDYMENTPAHLQAAKNSLHYIEGSKEFPAANGDCLSENDTPWQIANSNESLLSPLQEAFKEFTKQEKQIVLMIYHEGLNQQEMAVRLKVSQPRVNQIIMGIRKRMEEIGYKKDE